MNFKEVESEQKLQGSYYTPKWLSDYIMQWVLQENSKQILEPSCGDGVFFESLDDSFSDIHITAIDTNESATQIARGKLSNIKHEVLTKDFITWSIENFNSNDPQYFDAVVGNPPFIRYQYMEKELQENAQKFFELMNMKFTKHTNAWIPFVLASIKFLRPNGIIGMIVPSEILHVLYAKGLRDYLLQECSEALIIDPENQWFDGILQGVVLLMGRKKASPTDKTKGLSIFHTKDNSFAKQNPSELFNNADYVDGDFLQSKWTYALLTSEERAVFKSISNNKNVYKFSSLATADVGIVTGANKYFLVTNETVESFGLEKISHPMFGRSEHCPGIVYDINQHKENINKGYPTNCLYFESETDDKTYQEYINIGIKENLHTRYKCRIRTPWYKVPSVYSSPISMLKRSNGMPRLIFNELDAFTTDTAYRVFPKNSFDAKTLVCCFLNTLTALSAELEGRHYGGGVLELVPSEIDNLIVPYISNADINLNELNEYVKNHSIDEILIRQDKIILKCLGINDAQIRILQNAFLRIKNRRQHVTEAED